MDTAFMDSSIGCDMKHFLVTSLSTTLQNTPAFIRDRSEQGIIDALGANGIDWSTLNDDEKQIVREAAKRAKV